MTDTDLASLLARRRLPAGYQRWRLALRPGESRPASARDWADAIVVVRAGTLEVECIAGGRITFGAGDMPCLGWLPLRRLANPGTRMTRLIAVRRRAS